MSTIVDAGCCGCSSHGLPQSRPRRIKKKKPGDVALSPALQSSPNSQGPKHAALSSSPEEPRHVSRRTVPSLSDHPCPPSPHPLRRTAKPLAAAAVGLPRGDVDEPLAPALWRLGRRFTFRHWPRGTRPGPRCLPAPCPVAALGDSAPKTARRPSRARGRSVSAPGRASLLWGRQTMRTMERTMERTMAKTMAKTSTSTGTSAGRVRRDAVGGRATRAGPSDPGSVTGFLLGGRRR